MTLDKLFSIDLDEKISKITKNRYTEKNFFVIELIRSALTRGATKIDISIVGKKLLLTDNGHGIKDRDILFLRNIFNKNLSVLKRETVIESFLHRTGMGLLSMFTPSFDNILVQNTQTQREEDLKFENSHCKYRHKTGKYIPGTSITIFLRQGIKTTSLKEIVTKYCAHLKESIRINSQVIAQTHLLPDCFLKLKLKSSSKHIFGELGIPSRDNYCRIQLLYQNIPWDHKIFDPLNGLVFNAVIETKKESYEEIIHQISSKVFELYKHLGENYQKYSGRLKERIEELILSFIRRSGNTYFLDHFPVFRMIDSSPVSASYIKALSAREPIFYISDEQQIKNLKSDRFILKVTRKQTDFLINYLNIDLKAYQEEINARQFSWFQLVTYLKDTFLFLTRPLHNKTTPVKKTLQGDLKFLSLIQTHLNKTSQNHPNHEVKFIKGRFGDPVLTDTGDHFRFVFLKRNHKTIKILKKAIEGDTRNLILVNSLLPALSSSGDNP